MAAVTSIPPTSYSAGFDAKGHLEIVTNGRTCTYEVSAYVRGSDGNLAPLTPTDPKFKQSQDLFLGIIETMYKTDQTCLQEFEKFTQFSVNKEKIVYENKNEKNPHEIQKANWDSKVSTCFDEIIQFSSQPTIKANTTHTPTEITPTDPTKASLVTKEEKIATATTLGVVSIPLLKLNYNLIKERPFWGLTFNMALAGGFWWFRKPLMNAAKNLIEEEPNANTTTVLTDSRNLQLLTTAVGSGIALPLIKADFQFTKNNPITSLFLHGMVFYLRNELRPWITNIGNKLFPDKPLPGVQPSTNTETQSKNPYRLSEHFNRQDKSPPKTTLNVEKNKIAELLTSPEERERIAEIMKKRKPPHPVTD